MNLSIDFPNNNTMQLSMDEKFMNQHQIAFQGVEPSITGSYLVLKLAVGFFAVEIVVNEYDGVVYETVEEDLDGVGCTTSIGAGGGSSGFSVDFLQHKALVKSVEEIIDKIKVIENE